jgi:hypothetical protein
VVTLWFIWFSGGWAAGLLQDVLREDTETNVVEILVNNVSSSRLSVMKALRVQNRQVFISVASYRTSRH